MTRKKIAKRIAKVDRRPTHERFLDTQKCAKVGIDVQPTLRPESDAATTQNGDGGDGAKSSTGKIECVQVWPSDILSNEVTVGIKVWWGPTVSLDVSRAQKTIPRHKTVVVQAHRDPGSLGQHYQGEDPRVRHRERRQPDEHHSSETKNMVSGAESRNFSKAAKTRFRDASPPKCNTRARPPT
jgi:hypothetical protein